MSMAAINKIFCTLCYPSSVLATAWCPEHDEFLCSECEQRHQRSKLSIDHSILTLSEYNELPQFVKELKFTCDDHGQILDLFCSTHNSPCCIRCALTLHKLCQNVVPLTDLVKDMKTSAAMLDIESFITDLSSYLETLKTEVNTNINFIKEQEITIRDNIYKQRMAVNSHLDRLEKHLLEELHAKLTTNFAEIEMLTSNINAILERINKVSSDLSKMKAHASDVQSFLSLSHLQSMVTAEAECAEKLQSDRTFVKKEFDFVDKSESVLSIESLGDVICKEGNFVARYVHRKELGTELVDSMSQQLHEAVTLQLVESKMFTLGSVGERVQNMIVGVTVSQSGHILIAESNKETFLDCVSLHGNSGNLIKSKEKGNEVTVFNLSGFKNFDHVCETTLLSLSRSEGPVIRLLETNSLKELKTISMEDDCYGLTGYGNDIFVCSENGIRKYNTIRGTNELLVESIFYPFSFIDYRQKKLFYTRGKGFSTVSFSDESGQHLWTFENQIMLLEARGVVVDAIGRVFVAGNKANNIVCLTPDGRVAKEVQKVSSPLALCFDEENSQLVVCTKSDTAFIFRVCDR